MWQWRNKYAHVALPAGMEASIVFQLPGGTRSNVLAVWRPEPTLSGVVSNQRKKPVRFVPFIFGHVVKQITMFLYVDINPFSCDSDEARHKRRERMMNLGAKSVSP
jgi:hypothetical protein